MGIKRLLHFVKEAMEDIHVRQYAGKRVAVDTYCWIHRGCFGCAEQVVRDDLDTDVYVNYCMKFVEMLRRAGVTPVLVFDGCDLPSKKAVENERRAKRELNLATARRFLREGNRGKARDAFTKCINVTSRMALKVMNAARARGVDCIVAPYEADAQLTFLMKRKLVDAVITEDSDLLAYGCAAVLYKLDLSGRCRRVTVEGLGRVAALQGLTGDQFRHLCILSGCDYLANVRGVGIAKACRAVKASKGRHAVEVARMLHMYVKNLPAVDAAYAEGFEQAEKTFLHQLCFDPSTRAIVPLTAYPEGVTAEQLRVRQFVSGRISARINVTHYTKASISKLVKLTTTKKIAIDDVIGNNNANNIAPRARRGRPVMPGAIAPFYFTTT